MPSELRIEDDGFASVTLGGVTVEVDLYWAYNSLIDFDAKSREQFPDDKDAAAGQLAYTERVIGLMHALGFERVSARAADKFDAAIHGAIDALKKADADAHKPA